MTAINYLVHPAMLQRCSGDLFLNYVQTYILLLFMDAFRLKSILIEDSIDEKNRADIKNRLD